MADEPNVQTVDEPGKDASAADKAQNVDYGRIQGMIDKGVQQKESAILKSYFEQQGMDPDEAKAAITQYKQTKQQEASNQAETLAQLQKTEQELKSALVSERMNNKAFSLAVDLGIEKNVIPYVIKMAEFKDAVGEDGNIKDDVIQQGLEQVLKDIPGLNAKANENPGFKVGAPDGDDGGEDEVKKLRSIMGLK